MIIYNMNQNKDYNEINKNRYYILKEYPITCPICRIYLLLLFENLLSAIYRAF